MSESWLRIKAVLEAQGFVPAGDVNEDRYVGALKSGSVLVKVEVILDRQPPLIHCACLAFFPADPRLRSGDRSIVRSSYYRPR